MTNIKVLIYSGPGVGDQCFPGTKRALEQAQIQGYTFTYDTNTVINASTIQGFDVVFFPGGDGASKMYLNNSNIDVKSLEDMPTVGICSGAYIQASEVQEQDGSLKYKGWNLCPHTVAVNYPHDGLLNISFTDDGEAVLNRKGTLQMIHENGPSFRMSSGVVLASYSSGEMNGKPAIIMDTNGKVNRVLSGPHEELTPFYPDILGRMVLAAALSKTGGNSMDIKIDEIAEASDRVATFIKSNKRLPKNVTLNKNYIAMEDFLNLMVGAVINIDSGKSDDITYKDISEAPLPAADYTPGKTLSKSEYVQTAKNIQNYINTNNRAPNYATTTIGKLATNDLIYDYSLILAFYKANTRLPNYVTINQIGKSEDPTGDSIQKMIQDGTGITFNTITEFYNKIIIPYAAYSDPMYFDDLKTLKQEIQVLINNVKGNYTGNANQLNCCDFAGVTAALAREMGYGEYGTDIVMYGFRCPSYECYHAVVLIRTKEFSGDSVQVRDYQYGDILTKQGAIVDSAAGASDHYSIKRYWCEATNQLAYKEPKWLPYERL